MNQRNGKVWVDPPAGIPGGEVIVRCEGVNFARRNACSCWFADKKAHLVGMSPERVLAIVPELEQAGDIEIHVDSQNRRSMPAHFIAGRKLAADLHPVANPAFDPDDGSLYVTRSGSRGQQVPVSIYRIDCNGEMTDFSGDVTNPTGIAFDKSGQMFVTSRMEGVVYRVTPFKNAVPFARNLGVATGLAFDHEARMYVGDRTGTIHRVSSAGEVEAWAQLEPSVSAYHLAFGKDRALYVTGPTASSFESVMRIDQNGEAGIFFRGLGRPQGLAFDRDGNLYVAASWRGRRGIVRISPDGSDIGMAIAGMNVVGLAFNALGMLAVATNESVFALPLGIHGLLLG